MFQTLKKIVSAVCCLTLGLGLFSPVHVFATEALPEIEAEAYIVMDAATGQVLLARDEHSMRYPASITKIVTLGLVQEALNAGTISLDTQVEVSWTAVNTLIANAATIYLEEGEVVSVRDLMYGTQIRSANDAANCLAELLGGSIEGFADMMNAKVAQLGLTGTHFVNPHGLPAENHYTTAYDMGVLTTWAMNVPGFSEWFGATYYNMPGTNTHPEVRQLGTSNYIMYEDSQWYYEGVTGSKSGFTNDAGYTLVTTAGKNGVELICVVLQCELSGYRYTDTAALFDYCFANFSRVEYAPADMQPVDVPVYGGGEESLGNITVGGSGQVSFLLMNRLGLEDVQVEYSIPDKYVVGGDFTPVMRLRIPNSAGQYEAVGEYTLLWQGLEGVIASNTTAFQYGRGNQTAGLTAEEVVSTVVWTVLLTFVVLVAGRILYVRHRRKKRMERVKQRAFAGKNPAYAKRVAPAPSRSGTVRPAAVELQVYRSQNRRSGIGR